MDVGIFSNIDFGQITFAGLLVLGTVNVITIFDTKNRLDSRFKWVISLIVAIIAGFVPADLGTEVVNRVRDAVAIALAASGGYKVASKAGGQN